MKNHNYQRINHTTKIHFCHFILFILLFFIISGKPAIAQTEYKLEKGMVMEYEYIITDTKSIGIITTKTLNFNLEVLDLINENATIRLTIGNYERIRKRPNGNLIHGFLESDLIKDPIEKLAFGESIIFDIHTWGGPNNFRGIQKLKDNIILKLKNNNPNFKMNLSYDYIDYRFGEDVFFGILTDIFPYRLHEDKLFHTYFKHDKNKEITIIYLGKSELSPNYFEREFSPHPAIPDEKRNDYIIKQLSMFVDPDDGIIKNAKYISMNWIEYCNNNFDPKDGTRGKIVLSDIIVKQVSKSNRLNTTAIILLNITNGNNKYVELYSPSYEIVDETQLLNINSNSFSKKLKVDLPKGPKIVYLNLDYQYTFFDYFVRDLVTSFKLFIRPGDTINFQLDYNDKLSPEISGELMKENIFLNSVIKYPWNYQLLPAKESLQIHIKDWQLYLKNITEFNKSFQKIFEFEWNYWERVFKLQLAKRTIPDNGDGYSYIDTPRDSLLMRSSLNNRNGINSLAYRYFLIEYLNSQYLHLNLTYDKVQVFLRNWDKYFIHSQCVRPLLWYFSTNLNYKIILRNYNSFVYDYPNTANAKYFRDRINEIEQFNIGEKLPKFILDEIKSHLNGKLPKTHYSIAINKNVKRYLSNFRYRKSFPENYITYFLIDKDSLLNFEKDYNSDLIESKTFIFIGIDKSIINKCRFLKRLIIVLNPDNTIAGYYPDRVHKYPSKYLSWPQEDNLKPQTINLKTFWGSLIGLFLLGSIIVIIMLIRAKRRKTKHLLISKIAKLEMDAVRSRMNPHFLFNALSSIQNLVISNQVDKANTYLVKFAKLIRRVLEQSSQKRIVLSNEIETLKFYLELESLRQEFRYKIKIGPDMEPELIEIPPLLIQPHVENALIHGIAGMDGDGEIIIEFSKSDNNLICLVSDNGIGIKESKSKKGTKGLGQGWKITRERIEILNKSYEGRIHADILDKQDEAGTFVQFTIPME